MTRPAQDALRGYGTKTVARDAMHFIDDRSRPRNSPACRPALRAQRVPVGRLALSDESQAGGVRAAVDEHDPPRSFWGPHEAHYPSCSCSDGKIVA